MNRILITGGLGFIGSNFIEFLLTKKNFQILNLDKITYASNTNINSKFLKHYNYSFKKIDIVNVSKVKEIISNFKPNFIIHFAAESHVDNSINTPSTFLKSNIFGTFSLLEAIRTKKLINFKKFIHISTDEVYGDLGNKNSFFRENSQICPSSPYSASKAASDSIVQAWGRTYNIPYIITNCCNNFGKYQNKEKFIPSSITNLINNNKIKIYGNGKQIREWISVSTHAKYIYKIMNSSIVNERINIGSGFRIRNIDLAKEIIKYVLGDCSYQDNIKYIKDRKGHDIKYQINSDKLYKITKKIDEDFHLELKKTLKWYIQNNKK